MNNIIYPELSYKLMGLCFQIQKKLGRFCRERQYADCLEELLKTTNIEYKREYEIKDLVPQSPAGNKVDFLIENNIVVELKAKNFTTKEDYIQTQRYLKCANKKLGLIINFRNSFLKAKRVLNSQYDDSNTEFASFASSLRHSHRLKNGFVTLITVLIVSAVGAAIAVSLLLLGLNSGRTSFTLEQSNQAMALADACAEEVLQQMRDSTTFTGSGNLSMGQGTCSYTVTSQGGQNRIATSSATVGTIIRKVKISVDKITPNINVTSWQEVADF